jgi:hypothetical protein
VVNLPLSGHRTLVRDMSGSSARLRQPLSSEIPCDAGFLTRIMWLAIGLVIALGFAREIVPLLTADESISRAMRYFAFDRPNALPSWLESLLMAGAALLLFLCARLSRLHDPQNKAHWLALAVLFLFFSADKAVAIHELATFPLRQVLHLTDAFTLSWLLLGAPLLLAGALLCLGFLSRLPRETAICFAIAAGMFVAGAFGLELFSGHVAVNFGRESLAYRLCSSAEETLELAGMALFVQALLQLIAQRAPQLSFRFR